MLYHVGTAPVYDNFERNTLLLKIIGATMDCVFNGPAAVIVFFVISGFCIHYPNSKRSEFRFLSYISKRYIRIIIPLLFCLLATNLAGLSTDTVGSLVGWSIECEIIYYTIYPLLRVISKRVSWTWMIFSSLMISFLYIGETRPDALMYPSFGLWGNALIGLPCWLLGCKLAEKPNFKSMEKSPIVSRFGIFLGGIITFSLMLHAEIGFPWSLNIFSILVYHWLAREISFYRRAKPPKWLESAGTWSYSLYLAHGPISVYLNQIQPEQISEFIFFFIKVTIIFSASYVFYLLVEKPSHSLARRVGMNLANTSSPNH